MAVGNVFCGGVSCCFTRNQGTCGVELIDDSSISFFFYLFLLFRCCARFRGGGRGVFSLLPVEYSTLQGFEFCDSWAAFSLLVLWFCAVIDSRRLIDLVL